MSEINDQLRALKEAHQTAIDTKEALAAAIAELIGRQVNITGYPKSAVLNTRRIGTNGRPTKVSVPYGSSFEEVHDKPPLKLAGHTLIDADNWRVEVAAVLPEDVESQAFVQDGFKTQSYLFNIDGIVELELADSPDIN